jgi:hypothetical protein
MTIAIRAGIAVLCLLAGSASALNHAGVEIAPVIRVEGQARIWPLLGSALVHRSFIPFYGLALHGPADAVAQGEIGLGLTPVQITLVWYANELPKAQVEAHFRELFEQVTDAETRKRVAPRLEKFIALLPKAERGRSMVFYYDPDGGTQISVEGGGSGHFAGLEFNRALFSMWLGPQADKAVRDALTGVP